MYSTYSDTGIDVQDMYKRAQQMVSAFIPFPIHEGKNEPMFLVLCIYTNQVMNHRFFNSQFYYDECNPLYANNPQRDKKKIINLVVVI